MTKLIDLPTQEQLLPGNRACAGCALGIGLRSILKALVLSITTQPSAAAIGANFWLIEPPAEKRPI